MESLVNNKHGIKMFARLSDIQKVDIFDSNNNYFNDIYYDAKDENEEDNELDTIWEDLENSTLEDLCSFFGAKIYDNLEELCKENDLKQEETKDNEYINYFIVKTNNGTKEFYTFSY